MADAGELLVRIKADITELQKGLNSATKTTESSMAKISGAIMAAGAAYKVFEAVGKGIEFNMAAEQAQVAFSVMTGSVQKATDTLKLLKEYANNTPLEFKDIRDATQTMLSFGIAADDATVYIKQIGDISGGNADKLKSISLAFSQIQSTGKLMGQDLLQLINAGFNPLDEISKSTGKSIGALKDEMSKGLITFDMIEGAFASATSEGGRFFGMLEKQSLTVAGKLSTMRDAVDTAFGALTEAMSGPIKTGAEVLTNIAKAFAELPAPVRAAAGAIAVVGASLLATAAAAKTFGIALSSSFGPIGIAVAALTAGVVALGVAAEEGASKVVAEVEKHNKPIAELFGLTGEKAAKANEELALSVWNIKKFGMTAGELKFGDTFTQMAKDAGVSNAALAEAIIQSTSMSMEIKKVAMAYRDQSVAKKEDARIEKQLRDEFAKRFFPQAKQKEEMTKRQAELDKQAAEAKKIADKQVIDGLNVINQLQRDGLLTSDEAGQKKIAIHQKIVDGILKEAEEGKTLSKAQEKEARTRIAQIEKIESTLSASVKARIAEEKAASEEQKRIEKELSDKLTAEFTLRTDELIKNIQYQRDAEKLAFEERKEEKAKEAKLWTDATNHIANQFDEVSTNIGDAFREISKIGEDVINGVEISAEDIAGAAKAVIATVFEFSNKMIENNLKTELKSIDAITKAKLIAAGVDMRSEEEKAKQEYETYRQYGDEEEKQKIKDASIAEIAKQKEIRKEAAMNEELTQIEREAIFQKANDRITAEQNVLAKLEAYRDQDKLKELKLESEKLTILKNAEKARIEAKYKSDLAIFENQRAMTLVDGAAAIVKGFAMLGPEAGTVAMLVQGGITAAQIAIMDANRPVMPAFKNGTNYAPGGMALVGEQGPELVNIPRGSQVYTANETRGMMSGKGVNVTVNNYSPEAIDPSISARLTRNTMRQLSFQGAFA